MPPNSKKRDEQLAKQRLCQRRRYAEIKNDPQLLALEKEKRRQRYLKKKSESDTSKKTPRTIREQRKKWRENSKRYRLRKKEGDKNQPTFEAVQIEAVASEEVSDHLQASTVNDPLQDNSKADLNKLKYEELKKRKKLLRVIASYKKTVNSQARKIQRLHKLVKTLQTIKRSEDTEDKSEATTANNSSEVIINNQTSNRGIKSKQSVITESIKIFYIKDSNSTICAGKKQYITKNKLQMQKRYLTLPLKDLYQKFLSETKIKVSYSFFCRARPFWVVFPKKTNRETCVCQIHANMKLLIEGLYNITVIREKTYEQVLSKMCCDPRNIDCLRRSCSFCSMNHIEYHLHSKSSTCTFFEWNRVKKEIVLANGQKKTQAITELKKVIVGTKEAIEKFEKELKIFLDHTFKITNQYKEIKKLKENLNIHAACVRVDFSENYALKYGQEVQSFHFGGSRGQVSLHTAVIYTHSFSTGQITPKSMCTISDCLRHDAAAVWAHLIPLIDEVINLNPLIDTIHFLSDSPSSQYRNKFIFYIISQLCKDFPQLHHITWNYSEVGHGKGAPDGVGATLKRTADRMVTFGKNVGTFQEFYDLIKNYIDKGELNIILKTVNADEVLFRDSLLLKNLKPFRGTFSVYQVLWEKNETKTTLRSMSCFDCDVSTICSHGKHLGFIKNMTDEEKENVSAQIPAKSIKILSNIVIKASDFCQPSTSKRF